MKTFLCLFILLGVVLSAQAVPPVLNYAGQVAVNDEPFDGNGLFKFALVNADGNVTYWSNDGTSTSGSEPQASVPVPVSGGLYSLLLGNTAIQGMGAVDPAVFAQHTDAKLRVWFSDGVNGFQQLSPDRPFASVPYAFNSKSSQIADSVKSGAITTAQLNEQILKYLKPEITSHPQAPGLIFGGQTVNLTIPSRGKVFNLPMEQEWSADCGGDGFKFQYRGCERILHDGNYTVVVSNDFGSVTSTPTALQVDGTPGAHTVASIGMEMIFCPPGTFTMGSPSSKVAAMGMRRSIRSP